MINASSVAYKRLQKKHISFIQYPIQSVIRSLQIQSCIVQRVQENSLALHFDYLQERPLEIVLNSAGSDLHTLTTTVNIFR
jgi:hypothetical protein